MKATHLYDRSVRPLPMNTGRQQLYCLIFFSIFIYLFIYYYYFLFIFLSSGAQADVDGARPIPRCLHRFAALSESELKTKSIVTKNLKIKMKIKKIIKYFKKI